MTCIAFDGRTLAVDRRSSHSGTYHTTRKLFRLDDGTLLTGSGNIDDFYELIAWYAEGADPAKWPAVQKTDDWNRLVVVSPERRVFEYDRTPYPLEVLDQIYASGSGMHFALAAMYLGKSAIEAVEVASRFDPACGNGVDFFTFEDVDRSESETVCLWRPGQSRLCGCPHDGNCRCKPVVTFS